MGSLQARLTIAGTVVLLLGLALGGVVFDRLLESRLIGNRDDTLLTQATDRAQVIDAGSATQEPAQVVNDPAALVATVRGESAIVIFGDDGTVLASKGIADPEEFADRQPGSAQTLPVQDLRSSVPWQVEGRSQTGGDA